MQLEQASGDNSNFNMRVRIWYTLLLAVMAIFLVRLFYLQIIRHNYYERAALAGQLKQYEIPPLRGVIRVHNGSGTLPLVLNETLYTLFADPKFIKDPKGVAKQVQAIIGGKAEDLEKVMKQNSRYAVLAKKLPKDKKTELDKLKIKGLGTRDEPHRTYPQDQLAAQLLGFVNDEGNGKYGVEQYLEEILRGKPGELKAITDAQGVPLLADASNVITKPQNGKSILLTIDLAMQRQLEDILKAGLEKAKSTSGSALIMDPKTGAIKAMANLPTYKPGEFYKVTDQSLFTNSSVSSPMEVGSIMKVLTAAAALDQGVVNENTTYYDPSSFKIDGYVVKNIEEDGGPGTHNLADILQLSLNTGATWLLMQMGGGEINDKARNAWHDYMTKHYRFGKLTGIEQGYESQGTVPDPNEGFGLNLQFANTAFGQGMSVTPLQMGAALSSVLNGGTYFKPRLVDAIIEEGGKQIPKDSEIVGKNVVKSSVSKTLQKLMQHVVAKNHTFYGLPNLPPAIYSIGGKTGTAEIAKPGGGYYDDRFNGTFIGFVGGEDAQYVIVVRVNEPHVPTYAGAGAAAPIFSDLAMMLINNFGVTPKAN